MYRKWSPSKSAKTDFKNHKTRIIQIYTDLKAGYKLDGRGNRKKGKHNGKLR